MSCLTAWKAVERRWKLGRSESGAARLKCVCAVQTEVSGGDKSRSPGRPRFSGIGHVYAGLSDEEVEVCSPMLGPLLETWHLQPWSYFCSNRYCWCPAHVKCNCSCGMMPGQVMRLREENETLMETLVRTKVELAETQGAAV